MLQNKMQAELYDETPFIGFNIKSAFILMFFSDFIHNTVC